MAMERLQGVQFSISQEDLDYINEKLKEAGKNVPSGIRNVLNRVARSVRKDLVAGAKKTYTLKKGFSLDSIKLTVATPSKLSAKLESVGPTRTLGSFKFTQSKASGVKSGILKQGGTKMLQSSQGGKAFVGPGGKVARLIVQRESKKNYPLKVLHGPSVPKMYEMVYRGENGNPSMKEPTQKKVHDEIMKEVAKVFGS